MAVASGTIDRSYDLKEAFERRRGRVYLTGTQALIRLLLQQREADRRAGLRTGGYVTGYRGSPLAGLDLALGKARDQLDRAGIVFRPALNEALAATAVMGTQQVETEGRATVDGVFALWYGKGPGVDWAGDAIRHGNAYGSSPRGGVLMAIGDDHGAVSSTMAHQSDQTLAAWGVPVLNPADLHDYLHFGLYGWALSRFAGAWVGLKTISETVEGAAAVELPDTPPVFTTPRDFVPPAAGLHFRWNDPPSVAIEERLWLKRQAAIAFARANGIDRPIVPNATARLGIVTTGKAHGDLMEALARLGFEGIDGIARLGVRILKVGQSWPLEPEAIRGFAFGLETLLVVEEKRPLVEDQVKAILYDRVDRRRPAVIGKTDREGRPLLPAFGELRPELLAPVLVDLLRPRHPGLNLDQRLARLASPEIGPAGEVRTPWFCAGCPHNTSTRLPEGSHAMGGIGCHIMATWMDRGTRGTTQMGGEGVNWLGMAPFTATRHVFQNLGDGTYFHSGSLAIRQAVAANVPITFKILFNDAVAMTGGQPHDGPLDVARITRQVRAEGVERIAVVSDEPEKHAARQGFAQGATVHHRQALIPLERELRDHPGVSVLIYDQTCAAEKRRRRKRGTYPDPDRRVVINERVCEGCGDCQKQSNCVAIQPVETRYGTKRQIDQSACNKDFSCLDGFCPSFVTIEGATLRRRGGPDAAELAADLPEPRPSGQGTADILIAGVGGTGVLTVGALIGMAAHLEGKAVSVLDFTGLAQKGGAVLSHVRIRAAGSPIATSRIGANQATTLMAGDVVTAAAAATLALLDPDAGHVVANRQVTATATSIRDPRHVTDTATLLQRLADRAQGRLQRIDAHGIAAELVGDALFANTVMLGAAWQLGRIPLSRAAMERAIELNGTAVEANRAAFAQGRRAVAEPQTVVRRLGKQEHRQGLDALIAGRIAMLEAYQDAAYAQDYRALVEQVRQREVAAGGPLLLTRAVARNLARLMAYKDEYEVARLFTDGVFAATLGERFAPGGRLVFHMAPPVLARTDPATGRPIKRRFGPWLLPAMQLLAKGKVLRGSRLDPFGRTAERRLERRLIAEYRETVALLLEALDWRPRAELVAIAELPDLVRGFGPVKAAAVERYARERRRLLEALATPPAVAAE